MTPHIDQYARELAAAARSIGCIGGTPFDPPRNVGSLQEQLDAVELFTRTKGPNRARIGRRRAWTMCRSVVATSVTAPTRRPSR